MPSKKHKYLPFLMWLVPLLFFAYQFILRLWPGLMMDQIMDQFTIDATSFGIMASFYYYGYSGMQIPAALMLERYKVKYVMSSFIMLCGLAMLAFTFTSNFYVGVLARFLVGAGSAIGFLGVSKVISDWFPKEQYGRMVGLSFTFGLMGAIYGGRPVSMLMQDYSWHNVAVGLSVASMSLAVFAFFWLKSPEQSEEKESKENQLSGIKSVLKSPAIWVLALSNLLMVGALEGFADVWGVKYLMNAYGLTKADSAGLVSLIFLGMLFGGPVLAVLSRCIGHYNVLFIAGLGMSALIMLVLSNHYDGWFWLASLFFGIGVLCCYQVVVFSIGAELVSKRNLGVTIAFLNSINMLGGSFFHTLIGVTLDAFWGGSFVDGVKVYDISVYQYALAIIPVASFVGAMMAFLIQFKVRSLVTKRMPVTQ